MTESEASDEIARMTDASTAPVLDANDLSDLTGVASRIDSNGLYSDDSGWVPTWDLNAAAAEGWLRKAGRAAKDFNFAEDGQRFDRAQVYQHCMSQHTLYANKTMGVLT